MSSRGFQWISLNALLCVLIACGALGAACSRTDLQAHGVIELSDITPFALQDTIFDIRAILVDDTAVWTLSSGAPFIHAVNADGQIVQRFGRRGDGPGELLNPYKLFVGTSGDHLVLWDAGRRKLERLSTSGEHLGAAEVHARNGWVREDMRLVSYGEDNKMLRFGDGFVLQVEPNGLTRSNDYRGSELVMLDSAGANPIPLLQFSSLIGTPDEESAVATELVAIPLWTVCGEDTLVVFDPSLLTLHFYDVDGQLTSQRPLPLARRPLSERDIKIYVRHLLGHEMRSANALETDELDGITDQIVRRERARFSRNAPPGVAILCDAHRRVWVNAFSMADHPLGYSREWYVSGETMKTVRFPSGFRPHVITDSTAFGVLTDDLGVESLARVSLPEI